MPEENLRHKNRMISTKEFFIYLLIMAGSTYLIRALPFALVKDKIQNRFLQSFLYYIPYAVLMAMTFPAVFYSGAEMPAIVCGVVVAAILSYFSQSLTVVAVSACVVVYVVGKLVSVFF